MGSDFQKLTTQFHMASYVKVLLTCNLSDRRSLLERNVLLKNLSSGLDSNLLDSFGLDYCDTSGTDTNSNSPPWWDQ